MGEEPNHTNARSLALYKSLNSPILYIINRSLIKGAPSMRYSASGFYINQTYMYCIGDLGTGPKKKYLGWFGPENRHFVLFSAVGYSAKEF